MNFYKNYGNLYLNEKQINTLKKYNIKYEDFKSISELLYYLEYYLNSNDLPDLEEISIELSEIQYYTYTDK